MQKVEFFNHQGNQHDPNIEVCPFCNSVLIPPLPPKDSVVGLPPAESLNPKEGETAKEK